MSGNGYCRQQASKPRIINPDHHITPYVSCTDIHTSRLVWDFSLARGSNSAPHRAVLSGRVRPAYRLRHAARQNYGSEHCHSSENPRPSFTTLNSGQHRSTSGSRCRRKTRRDGLCNRIIAASADHQPAVLLPTSASFRQASVKSAGDRDSGLLWTAKIALYRRDRGFARRTSNDGPDDSAENKTGLTADLPRSPGRGRTENAAFRNGGSRCG